MTATQIGILILALIGLALTVVIFISYVRREMKFRALLKRVSLIVERSQGEVFLVKAPTQVTDECAAKLKADWEAADTHCKPTLHDIVERELGPPDEIPPRKNVSALTRKLARKPTAKQKG